MALDAQAKETALRQFTAGVYVLGSKGAGEAVNGMTATWISQVSFDPPLVAVVVEQDAHTRRLIDEGQVFSVNVVRADEHGEAIAGKFVKPARRAGNKLEDEEFFTGETGTPLLRRALSWVECRVTATHPAGDHVLYVGEVVGAGVNLEGEPFTLAQLGWHYGG
jgi:flavin reductase (DIM6/NTAB) family NADH-FMN oxidoreductase RutF